MAGAFTFPTFTASYFRSNLTLPNLDSVIAEDRAMNKLRALLPLFFTGAILLLNLSIAAQPGDETRMYEEAVSKLNSLGERIAQRPNDAALYFQRGSVYLNLYYLHADVAEYHGVVYVNDPGGKALSDLNRAIELDHSKSEYYAERGRFYDLQWGHTRSRESEAAASSWEKLRLLYWDNRSFDSAVKDYQQALTLARTFSDTARPLNLLASLYGARASGASFYPPAKIVRAEKQARLVFDDFDRSLAFTRKYVDASERPSDRIFYLRDMYRDKARAAIEFEEYTIGINTLTDGINEIEDRKGGSEDVCRLYALRGDIKQKLKDYDAAVRDYTYPIDHKYVNCDDIREKRGDAYSAKGDWQRAVEDYTLELTKYSYPHESLRTRRAKAYLKIGDAEKALADLEVAMTYNKSCSEQFRLRAEAYRMLNDENRAVEDEKTAVQLSRNKIGCSL